MAHSMQNNQNNEHKLKIRRNAGRVTEKAIKCESANYNCSKFTFLSLVSTVYLWSMVCRIGKAASLEILTTKPSKPLMVVGIVWSQSEIQMHFWNNKHMDSWCRKCATFSTENSLNFQNILELKMSTFSMWSRIFGSDLPMPQKSLAFLLIKQFDANNKNNMRKK